MSFSLEADKEKNTYLIRYEGKTLIKLQTLAPPGGILQDDKFKNCMAENGLIFDENSFTYSYGEIKNISIGIELDKTTFNVTHEPFQELKSIIDEIAFAIDFALNSFLDGKECIVPLTKYNSNVEVPYYSAQAIVLSPEINDESNVIKLRFNHPDILQIAYNGFLYRKPFLSYIGEYGFTYNGDLTFEKKGFPKMYIVRDEEYGTVLITIEAKNDATFTYEDYDYLINIFMKLITKMKSYKHTNTSENENEYVGAYKPNNSSESSSSSSNSNIYTSSDAWITDEDDSEDEPEIVYLSSEEPVEGYQIELINNSTKDLESLKPDTVTKIVSGEEVGLAKEQLRIKLESMYKDYKICTGIGNTYIGISVPKADIIIVIKDADVILGFATLQLKDEKTVFLDLICTNIDTYKYVGSVLMNIIKKITRHIGYTHITLEAVTKDYVIKFYKKHKFLPVSNNKKNLREMKRRVVPQIKPANSNVKPVENNIGYAANIEGKAKANKNKNKTKKLKKIKKEQTHKNKKVGGYRKNKKTIKKHKSTRKIKHYK